MIVADSQGHERGRFVADMVAHMSLEERLGQLDLFHDASDPALEEYLAAGLVGGVTATTLPPRLQCVATKGSRLGIPLLLTATEPTRTLSPWALAASWDEGLAQTVGAEAASRAIGGGFNCMTAPTVAFSPHGAGENIDIAAGDAHLAARLAAGFLRGADDTQMDKRGAVLSIPTVRGQPAALARDWSLEVLRTGEANALDCDILDRRTAQRAGFTGLLVEECRRIHALVQASFAQTSAGSPREAAERLLASGQLTDLDIEVAVRGVIAAKHALGLFRDPQRIVTSPLRAPGPVRHDAVVRGTFVLLRNEAGILPLSPVSDRVLVVGPADGAAVGCANALARAGIGYAMVPGLAQRRDGEAFDQPIAGDTFALSLSCDAARRADFSLVVLDERHFSHAEGGQWLQPTGTTLALVRALSGAGARLIAIIATGEPVDLAEADQFFSSALHCWRPARGFEEALADILSGRCSPQGRMPATVGRFVTGHGLGFGECVYASLSITDRNDEIAMSVMVRNSGAFAMRETVQAYARTGDADPRLVAFAHVLLAPGEEQRVTLAIDIGALPIDIIGAPFDADHARIELSVGKSISRRLTTKFEITPAMVRAKRLRETASFRLAAG